MTVALILFALAAAGGSLLAYLRFSNKPLPLPLALAHGAGAVAGLIVLGMGVMNGKGPAQAKLALGLFGLAALGGLTLFSFQLRKKPLPLGIVGGHGLLAIAALIVLIVAVVGTR